MRRRCLVDYYRGAIEEREGNGISKSIEDRRINDIWEGDGLHCFTLLWYKYLHTHTHTPTKGATGKRRGTRVKSEAKSVPMRGDVSGQNDAMKTKDDNELIG